MTGDIKDKREIYSIIDFVNIAEEILKEELNYGENVIAALLSRFVKEFDYINWYRFIDANCAGCVSGPKECDIAYGRGKAKGVWRKIIAGEMQSCPCRVNGTLLVDNTQNKLKIESIDLAEHRFKVVELLAKATGGKK